MAMSKLARSGMMDRLRKRMGEDQRSAVADKYGDEFRRGMEGAQGNPAADVSSALEPLRRAGQSAIDAGALRQGDSARAMGGHAEPDADDMGGPSDYDADDLAAPPPNRARAMDRLRRLRNAADTGAISPSEYARRSFAENAPERLRRR